MLCDIYSELSEDSNFRFDLHWARDLLKKCIKVYPKFFQLHATNIVQWNTWPKWKTSRWYRVSLFNSLSQVMSDVLDKKPALPHTHPHHPQLQNIKKKDRKHNKLLQTVVSRYGMLAVSHLFNSAWVSFAACILHHKQAGLLGSRICNQSAPTNTGTERTPLILNNHYSKACGCWPVHVSSQSFNVLNFSKRRPWSHSSS